MRSKKQDQEEEFEQRKNFEEKIAIISDEEQEKGARNQNNKLERETRTR